MLRGAIARGLVAHGLLPSIGLHHASEQNAFNLADDIIEPFRPIVDLFVSKRPASPDDELHPVDKAALVSILNIDVDSGRIVNWNVPTAEQLQEAFGMNAPEEE